MDIEAFGRTWFPRYFSKSSAEFHAEMHADADLYPFYAAAAPRRHAKTTNFTFKRVLRSMAYRLNRFVLIVSDTYNQACIFLESIRYELENNAEFTSTYQIELLKCREDAIVIRIGGTHEMMIMGMGTGQKFRGLKFRDARPDLVILDDIENDELVKSDERRAKLKRWFWGTLLPALADVDPENHITLADQADEDGVTLQQIVDAEAKVRHETMMREARQAIEEIIKQKYFPDEYSYPQILAIGTILHDDSLLANILKSSKFHSKIYQILKEDNTPLWPAAWTVDSILSLKAHYEQQNLLDVFYQEYFNVSQSQETKPFQLYWFPRFKLDEINDRLQLAQWYRLGTIDLAAKDKQNTDFNCIMASAYNPETDNIYILDYLRFKAQFHDIIEAFFQFVYKYRLHRFVIETNAQQDWFYQEVQREARIRRVYCDFRPVNHGADTSKGARIRMMQPRAKMGKIHTQHWMTELEKELQAFDKGEHDDVIDAMAMILEGIDVLPAQRKGGIVANTHQSIRQRGADVHTGY
jgi:predicted phage terminase large subunit-like protein